MRNVYYKSDFSINIGIKNSFGQRIPVPDYDFEIRIIAGDTEFFAGRFSGRLRNCRPSQDGKSLFINLFNHRLSPCQELVLEVSYLIPDADCPSALRRVCYRHQTGICLTVGPADMPAAMDFPVYYHIPDNPYRNHCGCRSHENQKPDEKPDPDPKPDEKPDEKPDPDPKPDEKPDPDQKPDEKPDPDPKPDEKPDQDPNEIPEWATVYKQDQPFAIELNVSSIDPQFNIDRGDFSLILSAGDSIVSASRIGGRLTGPIRKTDCRGVFRVNVPAGSFSQVDGSDFAELKAEILYRVEASGCRPVPGLNRFRKVITNIYISFVG